MAQRLQQPEQTKWRATGRSKDDFGQRFSWAPLAFSLKVSPPPINLAPGVPVLARASRPRSPKAATTRQSPQPSIPRRPPAAPHVDSSLPQKFNDRVRLHPRGVEFHPQCSRPLIKLHLPHSVDFAHAIDRLQLSFTRSRSVTKNYVKISHRMIP